MSDKFMFCQESVDMQGLTSIEGSYLVSSDLDWGWRTVIDPTDNNAVKVVMYNVSPDGKEALAVRAEYARQS